MGVVKGNEVLIEDRGTGGPHWGDRLLWELFEGSWVAAVSRRMWGT